MGGRDGNRSPGAAPSKKIDDSEGMCGGSDSSYDGCCGRICNPDRTHVFKDILRGFLVLLILGIIVTVIFLLCYFLLFNVEKVEKKDEDLHTLIKEFSGGDLVRPEEKRPSFEGARSPVESGQNRNTPRVRGGLRNGTRETVDFRETTTRKEIKIPEFHLSDQLAEERSVNQGKVLPALSNDVSTKTRQGDEDIYVEEEELNLESAVMSDLDLDLANIHEFVGDNSGRECVPLRLPSCSSSVPWALTAFPNWVNDNNLQELQKSLNFFKNTIMGARCSNRATEYACAILEPACGPDGIPLPPCKAFCEDIFKECSDYLVDDKANSIAFQCQRFPDSKNPNVCVNISKGPTRKVNDLEAKREEVFNAAKLPPPEVEEGKPQHTDIVVIENEGTTTELPVFICDHSKFLCSDGSDCLEQNAVCDGIPQCLDQSDEFNCTKSACHNDDFPCSTTKYCIPRSWLCDGADDCKDNSDERDCPETPDVSNSDSKLVLEASDGNQDLYAIIANGNKGTLHKITELPGLEEIPDGGLPTGHNKNQDSTSLDVLSQFSKFDIPTELGVRNTQAIQEESHFESLEKELSDLLTTQQGSEDEGLSPQQRKRLPLRPGRKRQTTKTPAINQENSQLETQSPIEFNSGNILENEDHSERQNQNSEDAIPSGRLPQTSLYPHHPNQRINFRNRRPALPSRQNSGGTVDGDTVVATRQTNRTLTSLEDNESLPTTTSSTLSIRRPVSIVRRRRPTIQPSPEIKLDTINTATEKSDNLPKSIQPENSEEGFIHSNIPRRTRLRVPNIGNREHPEQSHNDEDTSHGAGDQAFSGSERIEQVYPFKVYHENPELYADDRRAAIDVDSFQNEQDSLHSSNGQVTNEQESGYSDPGQEHYSNDESYQVNPHDDYYDENFQSQRTVEKNGYSQLPQYTLRQEFSPYNYQHQSAVNVGMPYNSVQQSSHQGYNQSPQNVERSDASAAQINYPTGTDQQQQYYETVPSYTHPVYTSSVYSPSDPIYQYADPQSKQFRYGASQQIYRQP